LAYALASKGDIEGFLGEMREIMQLDPSDPEPHVTIGYSLRDKGDIDGAIAEFREAVRLGSTNAHTELGATLAGAARLDEGIAEFCEALRLNPQDDKAQKHLVTALRLKQERDKTHGGATH
jgi:Flp pilus assembly protein TadD